MKNLVEFWRYCKPEVWKCCFFGVFLAMLYFNISHKSSESAFKSDLNLLQLDNTFAMANGECMYMEGSTVVVQCAEFGDGCCWLEDCDYTWTPLGGVNATVCLEFSGSPMDFCVSELPCYN